MDLANLTLREYVADFDCGPDLTQADCSNKTTLRRCRTREQGSALLLISHAIEYLIDSRLINQKDVSPAEREALAILLRANLGVYNEGTEIKPLMLRLRQWFRGGGFAKHEPANASF